jgi:plasmid stability protein
MGDIQVRELSEGAHRVLRKRAGAQGLSLQKYLRNLLEAEAATLTPEEAAEQARAIAARSDVTADDITDAADRTRRAHP